ncbi:MAG: cytochrome b/b6 domain-containing protein [Ignavibacterium sp.]|uniref:cytochrome b/b6 domain-containing protein n=1 Tax=Ignavibacterium sp. TaxID=2651167 RepID=UPI0040493807
MSCHKGFNPEDIPHADPIKEVNCVSCHNTALTKHSFHPQILRTKGTGDGKDVSCVGCHGSHDVSPTKSGKWSAKNIPAICGNCHKEAEESYAESNHGMMFFQGDESAPNCLTCHKGAITKSAFRDDKTSMKQAQEKLCLSCHLDDPEVRSKTSPNTKFILAYDKSVHGKALHSGNGDAANCVDCHSSHDIIKASDSRSSVYRLNIPNTCGKCHDKIKQEYSESIHGVSVARGNIDSPVCTSCHGEHNILKHTDPNSPVAYQNVSLMVCSTCHASVRLTEKYGMSANVFKTFTESYHGLALRGGSATVANCGSCHGVHDIKPSTDPTSSIYKDNLVNTCGKCHPGANTTFVSGRIHVSLEEKEEPILYWIATIYIVLIVTIIGGMFLHNTVDLYRKGKIKKLIQAGEIVKEKHGHGLYLRMTLSERIQHATMALSFIILVITGFMLRFPESWWVSHIRDISSDAFEYRSLIHRIAAVAMITISLYHLYYILFTKRGRQLVYDLLPRWQDVKDAIGVAKFNLGFSNQKPKLDRFSYVEKAEYWALIWGTVVMSVTGLIMWIYTDAAGTFSKLEWDIARTIHYFEAWLALLAIVVWHFYFVIFNPDVYPMNLAWLKGTLTEEEMAHEHPLELERLKAEQNKEDSESKNS